jgi:predicted ABC-type ATPase
VLQGEHDVPEDKLWSRFPRTLSNLEGAIARLPHVLVFDNSDLTQPFREVAVFDHGRLSDVQEPTPEWFRPFVPRI